MAACEMRFLAFNATCGDRDSADAVHEQAMRTAKVGQLHERHIQGLRSSVFVVFKFPAVSYINSS